MPKSARVTFERGEPRKIESLWESGAVREVRGSTPAGTLQRSYAADGTMLRGLQCVALPAREPPAPDARPRSVRVLARRLLASGKLLRETRWLPNDRAGDVATDTWWYLNGPPKERIEYVETDAGRIRRPTRYHDNGKAAFEGSWVARAGGSRTDRPELPTGTHPTFDKRGQARIERVYDARGGIMRERGFDEAGVVVRDDEVFEDGSRTTPVH